MSFKIIWTLTAICSYHDEIDYIYSKWNLNEVLNFQNLVYDEVTRISLNPFLGKINFKNIYSLTFSKQTTLFYRINNDSKTIGLIMFWNNLKNPEELTKLL